MTHKKLDNDTLPLFDLSALPGGVGHNLRPAKRGPGRPSGPRGFVIYFHGLSLKHRLRQVVVWLVSARHHARRAFEYRRHSGPRCAFGRIAAAEGRLAVHAATCAAVLAFVQIGGNP